MVKAHIVFGKMSIQDTGNTRHTRHRWKTDKNTTQKTKKMSKNRGRTTGKNYIL
jgi:hypothetical protein